MSDKSAQAGQTKRFISIFGRQIRETEAFDDPSDEHLHEQTTPFHGAEHSMIGRGKTALVVDPDEPIRQMLAGFLRGLRFERVVLVETVDEAKAALGPGGTIDLALIDWQVGEQSGFDLAADIRTGRVPPRRDLPIIMMAWQAEPRTVLAVQGLKINGLLIKPLSRAMLEMKVAAALDPSVKPAPKRILGLAS
jgi:two-component system, chemotaxis family, chemotaxis protein CheY